MSDVSGGAVIHEQYVHYDDSKILNTLETNVEFWLKLVISDDNFS